MPIFSNDNTLSGLEGQLSRNMGEIAKTPFMSHFKEPVLLEKEVTFENHIICPLTLEDAKIFTLTIGTSLPDSQVPKYMTECFLV